MLCELQSDYCSSGFTIPVVVRVTDVNDNTPNFVDAPYHLNISELTIVGSRIFRNIKAVDADQVRGDFGLLYLAKLEAIAA